jgi:lipopolysaccharide heptosyltransferase II
MGPRPEDPPLAGQHDAAVVYAPIAPPTLSEVPVRPPHVEPWDGVRRRLAIRLDAAGDLLMTTPALRALRARHLDDHLTLLTSSAGAAVADLIPELDEVIVYDPPWMPPTARSGSARTDGAVRRDPRPDNAMIRRLRAGRYDGAAIFTVHSQSPLPAALLCHLAGIPRRLAHAAENPYGLLTDWVPDPETRSPIRHETRRQLDLLEAVGIEADEDHLSIHVPDVATVAMRRLLSELGIDPKAGFAVIHPGAAAASRRYPPGRFGAVARSLAELAGWPIVVTGSSAEAPLADRVVAVAGSAAISLAGQLTYPELAALLALSPMLIAGNSGPVHLAAAVATPVVDVYAMTNVQHTPWRVPSRVVSVDVPCQGCRRSECPLRHHRCITGIEPADVVAAALDLATEVGIPRGPWRTSPRRSMLRVVAG